MPKKFIYGTLWLNMISFMIFFDFLNSRKLQLNCVYFYKSLMNCFIILFMMSSIIYSYNKVYRDYSDRLILNSQITNSEKTKFIFTTKKKAKGIEELLFFLETKVNYKDKIFAYPSIPLIYYISDTIPFAGENTLVRRNMSIERINSLMNDLCNLKIGPKVIVSSKINMRNLDWDKKNKVSFKSKKLQNQYNTIKHKVESCELYDQVFENNYFLVYEKKN